MTGGVFTKQDSIADIYVDAMRKKNFDHGNAQDASIGYKQEFSVIVQTKFRWVMRVEFSVKLEYQF